MHTYRNDDNMARYHYDVHLAVFDDPTNDYRTVNLDDGPCNDNHCPFDHVHVFTVDDGAWYHIDDRTDDYGTRHHVVDLDDGPCDDGCINHDHHARVVHDFGPTFAFVNVHDGPDVNHITGDHDDHVATAYIDDHAP